MKNILENKWIKRIDNLLGNIATWILIGLLILLGIICEREYYKDIVKEAIEEQQYNK